MILVGVLCHGLVSLEQYARFVFVPGFVFVYHSVLGFCANSGSRATVFVQTFVISHVGCVRRSFGREGRSLRDDFVGCELV